MPGTFLDVSYTKNFKMTQVDKSKDKKSKVRWLERRKEKCRLFT